MTFCGGTNKEISGLVLDSMQGFMSPSQNGHLTSYEHFAKIVELCGNA